MEPKKVGRALGIGVRVASNMVRQRVAEAQQAPPVRADAPSPATFPAANRQVPAAAWRPASSNSGTPSAGYVSLTGNAKRGMRAFGQAVLTPFTHAGGVLWLEITGLFFALFTLFFGQSAYRVRASWRQGPDHAHLLLYALLAAAFAWFSVSSFIRAYRKSKRGPASGDRTRP